LKFHVPSYALGFATGALVVGARDALRPVAVELGALGLTMARVGRGLLERQREYFEDLRADIEERFRTRLQRARTNGNGVATAGNGSPSTSDT
jgi:hypothetical protein